MIVQNNPERSRIRRWLQGPVVVKLSPAEASYLDSMRRLTKNPRLTPEQKEAAHRDLGAYVMGDLRSRDKEALRWLARCSDLTPEQRDLAKQELNGRQP